ncbi:MAG: replicative DNA helicase [Candidatus Omnitrophica bacterium]|nr:replicative DNA helicase [Candidatus Omnitrophota bacterium]
MELQDLSLDRLPPQNLEAEQAVLGSMLLDEEGIAQAVEILQEQDFYKDAHRKIFGAITKLYRDNQAADLLTLTEELKRQNSLEDAGGASYLAQLTTTVATAANAAHYSRIVKEKAILRGLIRAATQIVTETYESAVTPDVLLDRAEGLIFEIMGRKIKSDFLPLKEIIKSSIETIDALYQRKGYITGLPTGFDDLDHMTAGLQPSELVIVAGRPSMGKSAFALNMAEHVALAQKVPVAVFSLEMSRDHLVQRMLCSHARINAHNVRSGILHPSDWPRLTNAAGKLSEAAIFIDDTPGVSILELRAKARRLKARHSIGVVVLDYLQLMEEPSKSDNRQQEIATISRSLKALARELNVAVVAVSQLSRAPERRETFRPRLSDLRESGAIEQDADVVLLLYREDYYTPTEENQGIAEVIIGKQRNGPIGTVKLAFVKEFVRFENLAKQTA